jgi:hypothetical protein
LLPGIYRASLISIAQTVRIVPELTELRPNYLHKQIGFWVG